MKKIYYKLIKRPSNPTEEATIVALFFEGYILKNKTGAVFQAPFADYMFLDMNTGYDYKNNHPDKM